VLSESKQEGEFMDFPTSTTKMVATLFAIDVEVIL
jgi:hypothetical protein